MDLIGVNTGSKKLNDFTLGFQKGDLIVLAARSGVGKTAVSLWMARKNAINGEKVRYYSLEVTRKKLTDRIVCAEAEVNPYLYKKGEINDIDGNRLDEAEIRVKDYEFYIIDSLNDIEKICADIRQAVRDEKCTIAYIDQLSMVASSYSGNFKAEKLTQICYKLKGLALELGIPIVLMHQIRKSADEREDKIPRIEDLKDSAGPEESSDLVILLYRPDMYVKYSKDRRKDFKISFIVAKNREGDTGTFSMHYNSFMNNFGEEALIELDELPF